MTSLWEMDGDQLAAVCLIGTEALQERREAARAALLPPARPSRPKLSFEGYDDFMLAWRIAAAPACGQYS